MSTFDWFGMDKADLLAEFPGAAASDFVAPGDPEGTDRLALALDEAEALLLARLSLRNGRLLARVEFVEVVKFATPDQNEVSLPLSPADPPGLLLWRNWQPSLWPRTPPPEAAFPEEAWALDGSLLTLQPSWELVARNNLIASWDLPAARHDPYLGDLLVAFARRLLAGRIYHSGEAAHDAALYRAREASDELARLHKSGAMLPAFNALTFVNQSKPLTLGRG